jgi:hypothetical protein
MRWMVPPPRWLSWVNGLLALGFAAAAVVQWNDPDPAGWMAVYGGAALCCLLHGRARWAWIAAAALGALALAWAAALFLAIEGPVAPGDVIRPMMKMTGGATEEAREAIGLALVASWMVALVLFQRRSGSRQGERR